MRSSRYKDDDILHNITEVTSSPGNIWVLEEVEVIAPGHEKDTRVIFEAKVLDTSIPGHVAIDDVVFKHGCE